jgi:hypothetical protein
VVRLQAAANSMPFCQDMSCIRFGFLNGLNRAFGQNESSLSLGDLSSELIRFGVLNVLNFIQLPNLGLRIVFGCSGGIGMTAMRLASCTFLTLQDRIVYSQKSTVFHFLTGSSFGKKCVIRISTLECIVLSSIKLQKRLKTPLFFAETY